MKRWVSDWEKKMGKTKKKRNARPCSIASWTRFRWSSSGSTGKGWLPQSDFERGKNTLQIIFAWTAVVLPPPVIWRGMKLQNLVPKRYRKQVVRQFGDAKLVRLPNG